MNPFDRQPTASTKRRQSRITHQLKSKNKSSKLKDRRDKRQFGKLSSNSLELTHHGQPINYDQQDYIGSSDDDSVDFNDPNIQRKQTLNEVIAHHKELKMKRQNEQYKLTMQSSKIDDAFREIKPFIKDPQYQMADPDEYDLNMRSLVGDKRAIAVDRTKSIHEIVLEEQEKLKAEIKEAESESDSEASEKEIMSENENDSEIEENDDLVVESIDFPLFEEFMQSLSPEYLHKLRILHFNQSTQLIQLQQHLIQCIPMLNTDQIMTIYPHLFSLSFDYPIETAKSFHLLISSKMANIGKWCQEGYLCHLFQLMSKLYTPTSTAMSAILNLISFKLQMNENDCLKCVENGLKMCQLIHTYSESQYLLNTEIYVYALRYYKTMGLNHVAIQHLKPFLVEMGDLESMKPQFDVLFQFEASHPCKSVFKQIMNETEDETNMLQLQIKQKTILTTSIPLFGQAFKNETMRLKKRVKNVQKSTLRQIRKDAGFIASKKIDKIKKQDAEYKKYINKITGEMGNEYGQSKKQ
eukprot:NODE_262_length_11424_cov_0.885828.p2 type:complete len:524 gc:universal NODE_262_length_11424_cov_0.885828:6634-5063(-)